MAAWSQWVPKTCVKNHRKVVKLQLKQMCSDNNNIFVRAAQLDARNDGLSKLRPSHLLLLNLSAKFPVFLTNIFSGSTISYFYLSHQLMNHLWISLTIERIKRPNCFWDESDITAHFWLDIHQKLTISTFSIPEIFLTIPKTFWIWCPI